MASDTETIEFVGSTGATLAGILQRPEGAPRGSILVAHCFTCGKDLHTTTRLADGLTEAGYAVLRFDFTGLGESGGSFEDTTVTTNVRDLARAATALIQRGYGPCGMVGHSLGGAAAVLAAHRIKTVRSLAVLGAPARADHVARLFADEEVDIHREGCRVVAIAGRPFPITDEFLHDLDEHDDLGVDRLDRPLLVLHAVDDRVVEVSQGEALFARAAQPKAFVPLLDADHLLTDRERAADVLSLLRWWFGVTLSGVEADASD